MLNYSAAEKKISRLTYIIKTKLALQFFFVFFFFMIASPVYRRSENLIPLWILSHIKFRWNWTPAEMLSRTVWASFPQENSLQNSWGNIETLLPWESKWSIDTSSPPRYSFRTDCKSLLCTLAIRQYVSLIPLSCFVLFKGRPIYALIGEPSKNLYSKPLIYKTYKHSCLIGILLQNCLSEDQSDG